jgi:hypothetical protein
MTDRSWPTFDMYVDQGALGSPHTGVRSESPIVALDFEQWARIVSRHHERQTFHGPAQCYIEKTARLGIIGECLAITGHQNDGIALEPFGLVNVADRPRRRFGTKVSAPIGDLSKPGVRSVKLAQARGVPASVQVHLYDLIVSFCSRSLSAQIPTFETVISELAASKLALLYRRKDTV